MYTMGGGGGGGGHKASKCIWLWFKFMYGLVLAIPASVTLLKTVDATAVSASKLVASTAVRLVASIVAIPASVTLLKTV